MSKKLAGKCITRYSIPVSDKELNTVIGIIRNTFDSFGVIYDIEVSDDKEKKSKDTQSWTYGLFAERKHILVKIKNMNEFTRDYHGTLYSPITKIRFTFSKENGVSTYEKLQQLDDSLHHYPEVVPYCDMSLFEISAYTNGWYRYYRHKRKCILEHVTSEHSHFMYNTSITDDEFISDLTGYIASLCEVKNKRKTIALAA